MATNGRNPDPEVGAAADPVTPKSRTSGWAARVSLGRVLTPVASEFLLLAGTTLALTVVGLVMVLSASSANDTAAGLGAYDSFWRQGTFALIAVPLMFVISRFSVAFFKRIAWLALIAALVLQMLVFTPLGVESGGNRNWVSIAGQNLQPSEFLKLALCLWLGFTLWRQQGLLDSWKHMFWPTVPVAIVVIGSVLLGSDLGTAMVLVLIVLAALFFAGVRLRMFIIPVLLGVFAVAALAITSPDRMRRIMSFLDTGSLACYTEDCFQPLHGVWGLAGGGIFGLGLGNSREKYDWLPAAANDYIFAIVGEELGLIGCIVVLALFGLFAVGAFRIVRRTDDPFVRIASGAITVWILGQALINIGVVLRVFPVLGVPLPFMSAGGTSLISVLLAVGVLLAFARSLPVETPAPPSREKVARR
ncbi:MAG TPA: putative lipid II flippase FtsW [Microbacteriaceae bacterium]|nr:putative lipid II flippase FtsW [Microbacteriaceae bacterium]